MPAKGARYFDPLDFEDMGHALLELLGDPSLARGLVERGREREAKFTWEATDKAAALAQQAGVKQLASN